MTPEAVLLPASQKLPAFEIELRAPDLAPWHAGNAGLPGFWRFVGAAPGPHVAIVALVHGNEIAGAVALDRLLRTGVVPLRGTLTVGFANLDAYGRFDPAQPTASRYVDEDMNRLWDAAVLDGGRQSCELARARAMRPAIDQADVLLDLHSMLWPSEPLMLSGPTARGRALATAIGTPDLVVADHGHASGRRLIDYAPFVRPDSGRMAVLVEAGQHWKLETVAAMESAIAGLLATTGLADGAGQAVPRRDTLIAMDGAVEIRTPHDDCLLVMPSLRPSRGHTAVRLARFV